MTMSASFTGHQASMASSDCQIGLIIINHSYRTQWSASGLATGYLWYLLCAHCVFERWRRVRRVCGCHDESQEQTRTNIPPWRHIKHFFHQFPNRL